MSRIIWCIENKVPPAHFDQHEKETSVLRTGVHGFNQARETEKYARAIVNALCQPKVVDQVAQEWDTYGSGLRMAITDFANKPGHSGNVSKGISRLNTKLGGKILRREPATVEKAGRKDKDSGMYETSRAEWGFPKLRSDYDQLSPARKKEEQLKLAAERRAQRNP